MQRVTPLKASQNEWTARQLLEQWVRYLQDHDHSAGTVKKYAQAIGHFLAWYEHEEQSPLNHSALTPIALIGYRNALQHEQRKSRSTVNVRISALRSWCGWLTEQGYLAADPASHVKLVGGEVTFSRTGLKSSQVNALLRQAQNSRGKERNYAIIQVLLQTGIRLSECAALTFEDITLGERHGLIKVRAGKGNKARSIPLNASAREAISVYVAPRLGVEQPSLKKVIARWPKSKSPQAHDPVFISQKGGALVPEETSAHTLRHTFARSYLAQNPGDVVGLATLLGHTSLDTTKLYSEPSVEQLAQRVEQLNINAYSR